MVLVFRQSFENRSIANEKSKVNQAVEGMYIILSKALPFFIKVLQILILICYVLSLPTYLYTGCAYWYKFRVCVIPRVEDRTNDISRYTFMLLSRLFALIEL